MNAIGALDYATGQVHAALSSKSVKREAVVEFIDGLAAQAEAPLTLVVLDHAPIHHDFDPETRDRWLVTHRLVLLHLPAYSPELNPIEIIWRQAKYRWRRFAAWTKAQLASLCRGEKSPRWHRRNISN